MEGFVCFLGFSLGASLTIGVTRMLGRGLRQTVVGIARTGLAVTDSFRSIGDEARAEMQRTESEEPQAQPQTRRRRARGQDVRTIEVATQ